MRRIKPAELKITFRAKITLIIFGLFLFFILLEVGLRLSGFIILSLQEYRNIVSIGQRGEYRIMCLGESTTQGQYPPFLEEILNQRNIGIKFSVIDKGIPGRDSSAILKNVESYLDKYHPDIVVTMMGINDKGKHMPIEIPSSSRITLFIRSLKTYKLTRLLWLHLLTKIKESGLYQLRQNTSPPYGFIFIRLKEAFAAESNNIQNEDMLKKAIALNPYDDRAYIDLGWLYRDKDRPRQSEEYLLRAIELNPKNDVAYFKLGELYRLWEDRFSQAEGYLRKAITLNPKNDEAYIALGTLYLYRKFDILEAEKYFHKAVELNSQIVDAYTELGGIYRRQGRLREAEECFKKGLALVTSDGKIYRALASMYEENGQKTLAQEYYRKASGLNLFQYNPTLVHNYHELKEILDKRKIKFVCVQYPMRDIEPLKKIFEGQTGIIFVDNERIFKDAVSREGYKEYFIDIFGGDFGHCTPKGNRLLAKNIADMILKEVFGK